MDAISETYPAACKAGLDEEMVPDVHGLIEVDHAISYTVHKTRQPKPGPPHLPRSGSWANPTKLTWDGFPWITERCHHRPLGHVLGQQLKVFHPRAEIFQWRKTVNKVIELLFHGVRWR